MDELQRGAGLAAAAALSFGLVTGCSNPPPSEFPSADAALDQMHAQYACVNGVQGTAKIDSFDKSGRVRGEVYLFAVNPDRVRFDVVSPFGVNLYTLTSNGKRFEMLDTKEKTFLYGPAKACNLARLTQVPVPGHALVGLLRGESPVLVHDPETASIKWDSGKYVITIDSKHDAHQIIELEVHPDDWEKQWNEQRVRITRVKVWQRGVDLYEAVLRDHEPAKTAAPRVDPDGLDDDIPPSGPACSAELPLALRIEVPNTQQDVIFRYSEAAWNPPLISGAFTQPVPGGVSERLVDCSDVPPTPPGAPSGADPNGAGP